MYCEFFKFMIKMILTVALSSVRLNLFIMLMIVDLADDQLIAKVRYFK